MGILKFSLLPKNVVFENNCMIHLIGISSDFLFKFFLHIFQVSNSPHGQAFSNIQPRKNKKKKSKTKRIWYTGLLSGYQPVLPNAAKNCKTNSKNTEIRWKMDKNLCLVFPPLDIRQTRLYLLPLVIWRLGKKRDFCFKSVITESHCQSSHFCHDQIFNELKGDFCCSINPYDADR